MGETGAIVAMYLKTPHGLHRPDPEEPQMTKVLICKQALPFSRFGIGQLFCRLSRLDALS
jgi:hypothetical protein